MVWYGIVEFNVPLDTPQVGKIWLLFLLTWQQRTRSSGYVLRISLSAFRPSCSMSMLSLRSFWKTRVDWTDDTFSTAEFTAASTSSVPQRTGMWINYTTTLAFMSIVSVKCGRPSSEDIENITPLSVALINILHLLHFWLGCQVVRTLDLRSTGHGIESWPLYCRVQRWASC